ncbi:zinc-binding dehydrogenase [Corynebacterium aquilae]|uniref:Alcohol dehydrogenase n=1 Tax=Corynebacterium aquilae DSM 44791 TaxID=1431546 RepID=A0A1L7CER9_9CORY|nr:Zn-dependent alcohol dehydrogenase [Corynebacterium aquilae]APT84362.1 alcohol dehydrogenase [Corynebacterium aquilae DSM 44791]
MKAAVTRAVGQGFTVEEVNLAQPQGREVLVEVKASGLCHSDLHIEQNGFDFPFPVVLGHEISGVIAAVGPEVTTMEVGQHVVACLIQFCGACEECLSGRTYQCLNQAYTLRGPDEAPRLTDADGEPIAQFFGISGFAEKVLVHENQLAVVNNEIPFPQAAILGCATVTGAGAAINTAQVRVGDRVAVIGTGGVGLNAISGAALAGARHVIAIDIDDTKLEAAKKFGATDVINSSTVDPVEAVKRLCGGVDHAFEVIGLEQTQQQAYAMTAPGGRAYFIGIAKPGTTLSIDTSLGILAAHNGVQGVWMGSSNIKRDIPMYADMYVQGRLNLDDLITQEISIDEVDQAYEQLKKGGIIRSVITKF